MFGLRSSSGWVPPRTKTTYPFLTAAESLRVAFGHDHRQLTDNNRRWQACRAVLEGRDVSFSFPLRTAGGYWWQDSANRRRLTLNQRRLANDQPHLLAGWRSAEV